MLDSLFGWVKFGDAKVKLKKEGDGWVISKAKRDEATELIVPREHKGAPVVGIGSSVFQGAEKLAKVVLPSTFRKIGDLAFMGARRLSQLVLSEGLKEIGDGAFANCVSLTEVDIPASVSVLHCDSFRYCDGIKRLSVNKGGEAYRSEGNCVISKDGTLVFGCATSVIPKGVKVIGAEAFYGVSLGEVVIPSGVTEIKMNAFYTSTVEYVSIPDSVMKIGPYAFSRCEKLVELTLPVDLEIVEKHLFSECSALCDVAIPYAIKEIGDYAFYGCKSLEVVHYPGDSVDFEKIKLGRYNDNVRGILRYDAFEIYENSISTLAGNGGKELVGENDIDYLKMQAYDDHAVVVGCDSGAGSIAIPSKYNGLPVTQIKSGAFKGLEYLSSVIVPETVEWIHSFAFEGCVALTSVYLPKSLRYIETGAFSGCTALRRIEIPDNVIRLGDRAFAMCGALEEIKLPEGIGHIPKEMLADCRSLEEIEIPSMVVEIDARAFSGCTALRAISFPPLLARIAARAFEGCTSLLSFVLPHFFKTIGEGAFLGCTALTYITLSDGLETISDSAFSGCTALREVKIPDGVRIIGASAFDGCSALERLYIGKCAGNIKEYAFRDCVSLCEIHYAVVVSQRALPAERVFGRAGSETDGITVRIGRGVEKMPMCLFSNLLRRGPFADIPKIITVDFDDEEGKVAFEREMYSALANVLYNASHQGTCRLSLSLNSIGKEGLERLGAVISSRAQS